MYANLRATDEMQDWESRYDGPIPPHPSPMRRLQRTLGTISVLLVMADRYKKEGRHEDRARLHEECAELAAGVENMLVEGEG